MVLLVVVLALVLGSGEGFRVGHAVPEVGGGGGGLWRRRAGVVVVFPLVRRLGYFALHGCRGVGLGVGEAVEEGGRCSP